MVREQFMILRNQRSALYALNRPPSWLAAPVIGPVQGPAPVRSTDQLKDKYARTAQVSRTWSAEPTTLIVRRILTARHELFQRNKESSTGCFKLLIFVWPYGRPDGKRPSRLFGVLTLGAKKWLECSTRSPM